MKTRVYLWAAISFLLGCGSLHVLGSSPAITQGPWVSGITRSGALLTWVTDQSANSSVHWGLAPGSRPYGTAGDGSGVAHAWFVAGAPGNSKIYYIVCSSNGHDPESCSPENSFTTAPQESIPAAPVPPKPVDEPVIPTGTVLTVGANCDDPATGLAASWKKAQWGDIVEIDPAVTPECAGMYSFPAKAPDTQTPHRYILTRVKNAEANLAARPVTPADKPKLARFVHTAPNVILNGTGDPSGEVCFAGSYRWRQDQKNTWEMYRCNNTNPRPILTIPPSGPLRLTVPGHGMPEGAMSWVNGVTGPGAANVNGAWKIHVVDPNTVELHFYIDGGPMQATGAASGGFISLNKFQLEPVTEGATLPPTCKYGEWWHKKAGIGNEGQYHRTWYCNAPATANSTGEWMPYRIDPGAAATPYAPIELITNKAHHLIFQGLSFEPLALKADPQLLQYAYIPASLPTGTMYWGFVGQSRYNNHIYWDQTLAQCPDPDPGGSMIRCHGFGDLSGAHMSVKNSYFSGFQVYHSFQDLEDGSANVITISHGPGPANISNNHMECAGICVYYVDDVAATTEAGDLTFANNYIETPDRYWNKSPSWLGPKFAGFSNPPYWSERHRFETKRLHRGLITGNTFVGGWVWNNNASAICLCTRGGAIGAQISSLNQSTVTTYDASLLYDWGVEDLKPGDRVFVQNLAGGTCTNPNPAAAYTVDKVINSYTFTVSPSVGCTATRGNVVRLGNTTANITDVAITNNVFLDQPNGIFLLGHDSYSTGPGLASAAMQRILIRNNLVVNLDGLRVGAGQYASAPQVAPSGNFVLVICGMEDLTVVHNTVYPRTEGAFINSDSGCGPSSGLVLKANIFEYMTNSAINNDGKYFGSAALDNSWTSGRATQYEAAYNVILRPGGGSGGSWDPTQPPFGPYPALTKWFDSYSGPFPFKNPAAGDFSLTRLYRSSDKCYKRSGDCTDDGKDPGVDMSLLPADAVARIAGHYKPPKKP